MRKIQFSITNNRLPVAAFAVAKDGETPTEAVMRSIGRTTGLTVHHHVNSWDQGKDGKRVAEHVDVTLTERTQVRGGGYPIAYQFRAYVNFD